MLGLSRSRSPRSLLPFSFCFHSPASASARFSRSFSLYSRLKRWFLSSDRTPSPFAPPSYFTSSGLPRAPIRSDYQTSHSILREDKYSYLTDPQLPAAHEYLTAERHYFESELSAYDSLRASVYHSLADAPASLDAPMEELGPYYYFVLRDQKFPRYCRIRRDRKPNEPSDLECVLDLNLGPRLGGLDYCEVKQIRLSADHQRLAVTVDRIGNERYSIEVRDLLRDRLGHQLELIPNASSSAFSLDGQFLYYSQLEQRSRASVVKRHKLGSPLDSDEVIYSESDPRFGVSVSLTKDHSFLLINSADRATNEIRMLDLNKPNAQPVTLWPRREGVLYSVEHHRGHLIVLSNAEYIGRQRSHLESLALDHDQLNHSPLPGDNRVYLLSDSALASSFDPSSLLLLSPARKETQVLDIDVFEGNLVLYEVSKGTPRIRIQRLDDEAIQLIRTANTEYLASLSSPSGAASLSHPAWKVLNELSHFVPLPSPVGAVTPGVNGDFTSDSVRFSFSSPSLPVLHYHYSISGRHLSCLDDQNAVQAIRDSLGLRDLISYRAYARSPHDGTMIPVTLTHRRDIVRDSSNPCLIEVYGAYGKPLSLDFSPLNALLMANGWIIVHAHVRGGGENGAKWHEQGKLFHKRNSMQDFAAVVQWLVDNRFSEPRRMAGFGASAGALTLSAAVNDNPHLLAAVVLKVPLLDPLSASLDFNNETSSFIHSHDSSEFGQASHSESAFHYLSGYSPYQNLHRPFERPSGPASDSAPATATCFPHTLVSAALSDARVPIWQPLKYVARLRELIETWQSQSEAQSADAPSSSLRQPLVLLEVTAGGHSGGSSESQLIQQANLVACLYKSLQLQWKEKLPHS